jgi:WD repeat-containing protein 48
MAKKKRQRISYGKLPFLCWCAQLTGFTVLPLASTPGGHRLGVNGLAFDAERSILYVARCAPTIAPANMD